MIVKLRYEVSDDLSVLQHSLYLQIVQEAYNQYNCDTQEHESHRLERD